MYDETESLWTKEDYIADARCQDGLPPIVNTEHENDMLRSMNDWEALRRAL